jgi:hypothetical protein
MPRPRRVMSNLTASLALRRNGVEGMSIASYFVPEDTALYFTGAVVGRRDSLAKF